MKVNSVLLVGMGSIGKRHLNNVRQLLPDAKLIVLRTRQSTEPVDGCETVASLDEAISLRPDMAVICTPSNLHLQIAERLAVEGVHLFIEKPLSNSLSGTESFIEMVDQHELKVMVGYNLRFSPSLLAFKSLLETEEYGPVLMASAEVGQYLPDWRPDVDYQSTVSARSDLGGGVLLELSHELDYLIWLFGDVVSTSSRLMNVSDLELDVEDLVLAQVNFRKDGCDLPVAIHLDFLQRQPYRRCKVISEKANIIWDAIKGCVEVHQKENTSVVFQDTIDGNLTYIREMRQFIECIEKGAEIPIDVNAGARVLRLVEAMRRSSMSGSVELI